MSDDSCYLVFREDSTECWLRARFGAVPTPGRCDTCADLHGYVSLWCKNKQAIKHFGTSLPGREHCPFWREPAQDGPPLIPLARLLVCGPEARSP